MSCWCKECNKEYRQQNSEQIKEHKKEYYQNNTEKIKEHKKEYYQQNTEQIKEKNQKNVLGVAINAARYRALKKNLDFDITLEWLEQRYTGFCELSRIEFQFADKGASPKAPSLDRIDSSRGYTIDNVRIIITALNLAINQWGTETYEQIAKAYFREQGYELIKKSIDTVSES